MKEIFERLLNLIKKTGDKVVFYDSKKGEAYVVMRMEDYEKMTIGENEKGNLTNFHAPDKIEKINQDIAMWREEEKNTVNDVPDVPLAPDAPEDSVSQGKEEENQFYFEPVE